MSMHYILFHLIFTRANEHASRSACMCSGTCSLGSMEGLWLSKRDVQTRMRHAFTNILFIYIPTVHTLTQKRMRIKSVENMWSMYIWYTTCYMVYEGCPRSTKKTSSVYSNNRLKVCKSAAKYLHLPNYVTKCIIVVNDGATSGTYSANTRLHHDLSAYSSTTLQAVANTASASAATTSTAYHRFKRSTSITMGTTACTTAANDITGMHHRHSFAVQQH